MTVVARGTSSRGSRPVDRYGIGLRRDRNQDREPQATGVVRLRVRIPGETARIMRKSVEVLEPAPVRPDKEHSVPVLRKGDLRAVRRPGGRGRIPMPRRQPRQAGPVRTDGEQTVGVVVVAPLPYAEEGDRLAVGRPLGRGGGDEPTVLARSDE